MARDTSNFTKSTETAKEYDGRYLVFGKYSPFYKGWNSTLGANWVEHSNGNSQPEKVAQNFWQRKKTISEKINRLQRIANNQKALASRLDKLGYAALAGNSSEGTMHSRHHSDISNFGNVQNSWLTDRGLKEFEVMKANKKGTLPKDYYEKENKEDWDLKDMKDSILKRSLEYARRIQRVQKILEQVRKNMDKLRDVDGNVTDEYKYYEGELYHAIMGMKKISERGNKRKQEYIAISDKLRAQHKTKAEAALYSYKNTIFNNQIIEKLLALTEHLESKTKYELQTRSRSKKEQDKKVLKLGRRIVLNEKELAKLQEARNSIPLPENPEFDINLSECIPFTLNKFQTLVQRRRKDMKASGYKINREYRKSCENYFKILEKDINNLVNQTVDKIKKKSSPLELDNVVLDELRKSILKSILKNSDISFKYTTKKGSGTLSEALVALSTHANLQTPDVQFVINSASFAGISSEKQNGISIRELKSVVSDIITGGKVGRTVEVFDNNFEFHIPKQKNQKLEGLKAQKDSLELDKMQIDDEVRKMKNVDKSKMVTQQRYSKLLSQQKEYAEKIEELNQLIKQEEAISEEELSHATKITDNNSKAYFYKDKYRPSYIKQEQVQQKIDNQWVVQDGDESILIMNSDKLRSISGQLQDKPWMTNLSSITLNSGNLLSNTDILYSAGYSDLSESNKIFSKRQILQLIFAIINASPGSLLQSYYEPQLHMIELMLTMMVADFSFDMNQLDNEVEEKYSKLIKMESVVENTTPQATNVYYVTSVDGFMYPLYRQIESLIEYLTKLLDEIDTAEKLAITINNTTEIDPKKDETTGAYVYKGTQSSLSPFSTRITFDGIQDPDYYNADWQSGLYKDTSGNVHESKGANYYASLIMSKTKIKTTMNLYSILR